MTADEIYDSETNTEEPPFDKITINTDYKIKTSLEEPPMDLELKPLSYFDIDKKDKKGTENVAGDHLSRIDNNESSDDSAVDENFPGEPL
ncbi:hypothetical protein Tco_0231749 [Tanacetum coccineum]